MKPHEICTSVVKIRPLHSQPRGGPLWSGMHPKVQKLVVGYFRVMSVPLTAGSILHYSYDIWD